MHPHSPSHGPPSPAPAFPLAELTLHDQPASPPSQRPPRTHIPPPLALAAKAAEPPADELMTARGTQFPGLDTARHRFQPYAAADPAPKPAGALFLHTHPPGAAAFRAIDDGCSLRSSCSSLASSSSHSSGYFPSLPFDDPSPGPGPREPLFAPFSSQPALFPPLFPPASAAPSNHRPSLPSAGLAYPAAAFTPSAGSPPIASASSAYFHFDSAGAGRRHTVSAYASPLPIELSLVGHPEIGESLIKEEKRRRNKESSQRFRDRTRERQREKQERLEYLERRTKQLEEQLKGRRGSMPDHLEHAHQPAGGGAEREMIERLQTENEALRSSLKTATDEINRLQQLAGSQSPHSPLSIGPYAAGSSATIPPQPSPPTSASDLAPGSQASSPANDPHFAAHRPASPAPFAPASDAPAHDPFAAILPQHQHLFHHHHLAHQLNPPADFWELHRLPKPPLDPAPSAAAAAAAGWQPAPAPVDRLQS
ncbi:hypothetical protein PtA15_4A499 [Puccinia triticina]|uniref:BZIP domain-containing protein n=1 Tax=Puccinia triticina TaxID=208348 RepID=A0ABY7CGL9_9BASI|nr:uncharacterized protein PtA15_4A499 [Puccinia triticina]WAQ84048.1 hypothetical protein PtA15_4A499 [Puccinia triticina]